MTDFMTPSSEELSNRRRALKKQRQMRNLQAIWRFFAVLTLMTGTAWLIRHPFWLSLYSHEQIIIHGNSLLSDESIYTLLQLDYPKPLLEIEPEKVAAILQTQSPIALVQVSRQLLPPRLEITLQERQPVAVTIPPRPETTLSKERTLANHPGLLDSEGYWMPQDAIATLNDNFEFPTLTIRGFHERYRAQWPELFKAIQTSSVEIIGVDWRSPNNLILETELGIVHLGIYDAQLIDEQISTLSQFRPLRESQNETSIEYIDLSNPRNPAVKVSEIQQN